MSRFQLFGFILQTQVGIGVLAFPYALHLAAGRDGWISVILAGGVIQLLLLCYIALCARFPEKNIFEFAPLLLGKWIGSLVTFAYVVYFAMTSTLIILLEMVFVELWILPFSNPWLVIIVNGVILLYFAKESAKIIARYHTLISFILILMLALLCFGHDNFDYRYLLPIGDSGWSAVLLGMKSSVISFLGFELLLVISSDVKQNGKSLVAPMLWANGSATFFYLIVVLICSFNFSPEALVRVPQPVPFYMNGISLPFVERLDLLFLSLWLVKVTATLTSYVYATGKGLGHLFHRNKQKIAIYYMTPLICIAGLFWRSDTGIAHLTKMIEFGAYFVLGFPVALLLIAWITGKKEGQAA
ncbi:endospore germination permease [Paenibacillus sp. BC26]|uniref:GerAB/ArcD/ProY family transporter n=1 Tax=Paenibacillus sp. BC26 TaxID=1881032 RepID=UPI0008F41794|nr:endospore germination permease [Paenibacillus sp. BC26]SFS86247.1 spore germination protein (amino acid permease) [Paenibacillus sp. BC26]